MPEARQTVTAQTEQERLDRMREEAFAAVRSKKPVGSLLGKPRTREEERRELFGD